MSRIITLHETKLKSGETIAYRKSAGGEKTMVLLHGNFASSKFLEPLIECAPSEYTVYAPDLRGFGDSSYNKPVDSHRDYAGDIIEWADALGLTGFALCGWSLGGCCALQLAALRPEIVTHLILLASGSTQGFQSAEAAAWEKQGDFIPKSAAEAYYAALKPFNLPEMRPVIKSLLLSYLYPGVQLDPQRLEAYTDEAAKQRDFVSATWATLAFNISGRLSPFSAGTGEAARLNMPVLLLRGDADTFVSEEEVFITLKDLKGASYVKVAGAGHGFVEDRSPEIWREIERFISS